MSLPPRTQMWLTVSCATEMAKFTEKTIPEEMIERRQRANDELDRLQAEERRHTQRACNDITETGNISPETQNLLDEVRKNKKAAEIELKVLPKSGDSPNPFVTITIDDEEDKDVKPMLFTKAVRGTTNPIWKEKFEEFPLEMYLTGKMCHESFHNGCDNYRPQKLVFHIYHDDGVQDSKKVPKDDEVDSWKRDKPQRELMIGKAEWDWFDLCRRVGCPEFEKEFQIMHPYTHKRIKDAFITVKVRLCAPKIVHCMHGVKFNGKYLIEQPQEVVEVEETLKPKRSKSRKSIHGDDCWCSRCQNSSPRRIAPRRSSRRKI